MKQFYCNLSRLNQCLDYDLEHVIYKLQKIIRWDDIKSAAPAFGLNYVYDSAKFVVTMLTLLRLRLQRVRRAIVITVEM